jgi:hypothetical protein
VPMAAGSDTTPPAPVTAILPATDTDAPSTGEPFAVTSTLTSAEDCWETAVLAARIKVRSEIGSLRRNTKKAAGVLPAAHTLY